MLHFHHGYVTCLYVPLYLVGDACAQIVVILLVYVSISACCSALYIFEKHMLAFVDLISALPIRRSKVPNTQFMLPGEEKYPVHNSCFQGVLRQGKENWENWEKCICSGGACIHALGSSFSPEF
jgi:hypothetical protein